MTKGVTFQTRARTVDHLGREQIADTPTAVSELWKNSYDAYSSFVDVTIFDSENPTFVLCDDGHGMSREEFESRWLVLGTESKVAGSKSIVSKEDRNGIPKRVGQGQKGIGRLSSAKIGRTLLIISKRRDHNYVASLISWDLFENPFLNIGDISIPVAEGSTLAEVRKSIPSMVRTLLSNVPDVSPKKPVAKKISARAARIQAAWQEYAQYAKDHEKTSIADIRSRISEFVFNPDCLGGWTGGASEVERGTVLVIQNFNSDIYSLLQKSKRDSAANAAYRRFIDTLNSFSDPYWGRKKRDNFAYAVSVVRSDKSDKRETILTSDQQPTFDQVSGMEHQIVGKVDDSGVFRGKVKAFGEWVELDCVIDAPNDLTMPASSKTKVGSFDVFISAFEFARKNTTHEDADWQSFSDITDKYAGFLVFRDGLRVLPYGRLDNDFFEIEERRSRNAGREYWNKRKMIGRIALTQEANPNLRDKAGREGLIDNKASQAFRSVVINVLMTAARRYFGSSSEIRKKTVPKLQAEYKEKRLQEAHENLRKKVLKDFATNFKAKQREIKQIRVEVDAWIEKRGEVTQKNVHLVQAELEDLERKRTSCDLGKVPTDLGALEDQYEEFEGEHASIAAELQNIQGQITAVIDELKAKDAIDNLAAQIDRDNKAVKTQIASNVSEVQKTLEGELQRVRRLGGEREAQFSENTAAILLAAKREKEGFGDFYQSLRTLYRAASDENSEIFGSYIRALRALSENIDLEMLATSGLDLVNDLREQLDRLNALAQLGIAVEITGHELQSYDDIIGAGLKNLPKSVKASKAYKDIQFGYEGLTDQLRFLSPLRLAGEKVQVDISGKDIFEYLSDFFGITLAQNDIKLEASDRFVRFRIFERPSRLYPVFMNLVNNSIYWVSTGGKQVRKILLDVIDDRVIVSDSGPGVAEEDLSDLFTLFFSRKAYGGRGVGLYLSRANLAAGGHKVEYIKDTSDMPLGGANFAISFAGGEFEDND